MLIPANISQRIPLAVMPAMLESACDYANQRVAEVDGPEWADGRILVAEWDFLRRGIGYRLGGIGRVLFLDFIHPVEEIHTVRFVHTGQGAEAASPVGAGGAAQSLYWNKRGLQGLEVRNFHPWNVQIEAEYTPADRNAFRDSIALELAVMYIGYPASLIPQSSGVRVPGATLTFDRTEEERKSLSRLNTSLMPLRLPDNVRIKADDN